MSENTLGRANEVKAPGVGGSEDHGHGCSIGRSDLRSNGRPAVQRQTLEPKEEEDKDKEAFNVRAFHQLLNSPGRRQEKMQHFPHCPPPVGSTRCYSWSRLPVALRLKSYRLTQCSLRFNSNGCKFHISLFLKMTAVKSSHVALY